MRTKLIEGSRIAIGIAFFAAGALMLFDTVRGAVTRVDSDWSFLLFLILFTLLFCGVFFASGYLLLCGRYRSFASIWVVLAAFGVFGLVGGVPSHVQNLFSLQSTDWRMGLLQTSFLFVAFYVARWFLHATFRLLDRLLPREPHHAIPMPNPDVKGVMWKVLVNRSPHEESPIGPLRVHRPAETPFQRSTPASPKVHEN